MRYRYEKFPWVHSVAYNKRVPDDVRPLIHPLVRVPMTDLIERLKEQVETLNVLPSKSEAELAKLLTKTIVLIERQQQCIESFKDMEIYDAEGQEKANIANKYWRKYRDAILSRHGFSEE